MFVFMVSVLFMQTGIAKFSTELSSLLYIGLLNIGIGLFFLRNFEIVLDKFRNRLMVVLAVLFVMCYIYLFSDNYQYGLFWVIEVTVLMLEQIIHSIKSGG